MSAYATALLESPKSEVVEEALRQKARADKAEKEVERLRKLTEDAISCVYSAEHTARLTAELRRTEGGD